VSKPKLSLVGPAIRPQCWSGFIKGLYSNDIDYEIIFLGPNPPICTLPTNFHHIKTDVKPAQCYEAGVRLAQGELIILAADDLEFLEDHPLDKLVAFYDSINDSKAIASCVCMMNNQPWESAQHIFGYAELLPEWVGVLSKEYYLSLLGLDSRFLASYVLMDLDLRVWRGGGRVISSGIYCNEYKSLSSLWKATVVPDEVVMEELWLEKGKGIRKQRKEPVMPFSNYKILEESQGPKGRWV